MHERATATIAVPAFGANAASASSALAGRCVNAIVRIKPMRSANTGANSCEKATQQAGREEDSGRVAAAQVEAQVQPQHE